MDDDDNDGDDNELPDDDESEEPPDGAHNPCGGRLWVEARALTKGNQQ